MQFIKNFFNHDKIIVGLTGLRKRKEFVKVTMPEFYKKTRVNTFNSQHYLF